MLLCPPSLMKSEEGILVSTDRSLRRSLFVHEIGGTVLDIVFIVEHVVVFTRRRGGVSLLSVHSDSAEGDQ